MFLPSRVSGVQIKISVLKHQAGTRQSSHFSHNLQANSIQRQVSPKTLIIVTSDSRGEDLSGKQELLQIKILTDNLSSSYYI
jgi:hypothetical protein